MISLTSSGSSLSDMAVYPDRSEKRTVTCFRSPSMDSSFLSMASSFSNFCPQLLQNLLPGGFALPHFGQVISNGLPHSLQNPAPSGLSNWHFGHFISVPLYVFSLQSRLAKTRYNVLRNG